jgi:hypothetical protein
MNDNVVFIVYVYYTLFYSTKESYIQEAAESLRQENVELEVKSDVAVFLGVLMTKKPDGSIQLTQTGLMQRILAASNMADLNTKETPVEHGCLPLTRTEIRRKELTAIQLELEFLGILDILVLILDLQQVSVIVLRIIQDNHMKGH